MSQEYDSKFQLELEQSEQSTKGKVESLERHFQKLDEVRKGEVTAAHKARIQAEDEASVLKTNEHKQSNLIEEQAKRIEILEQAEFYEHEASSTSVNMLVRFRECCGSPF